MTLADESWREHAACTGQTELFFLPTEQATMPWAHDPARLVCMSCPVFDDCERWEMQHPQRHGIWAGRTPAERDVLRRKRRMKRLTTASY